MGVSLPTLKRWLTGRGLSLDALELLMNSLGLDWADLAAPGADERGFQYTREQEELLAREPRALAAFDRILREPRPRLTDRRISRALEEVGLIERLADGDRVRARVRGEPRWIPDGPLSRRYKRQAIDSFLERCPAPDLTLGLHRIVAEDWRRAQVMADELRNFVRTAESRARLSGARERSYGVLLGLSPFAWDALS
jgi:hypothetical protein